MVTLSSPQMGGSAPAAMDEALATAPSSPERKNDANRILKRGDLARIVSGKPSKLKDHNGDLGRVLRSIPARGEDDENNNDKSNDQTPGRPQHHPFLYDVELVLGGKLTNVQRCFLHYTTAFDEGMTGEARQPRKRKPSQIQANANAGATATATANATKPNATKKTKAETGTVPSGQGGARKRGAAGGGTAAAKSSKKQKKAAQSAEATTASIIAAATNANGMDLFERHRREFERSVVRLEKADVYCFFSDEVPPEFQECYDWAAAPATDASGTASTTVGTQQSQSAMEEETTTALPRDESTAAAATGISTSNFDDDGNNCIPFTSRPPFNIIVLRQRMEHGRYILNREQFEIDERIKLMTPYFKSIRRKIPKSLPKFPVRYAQGINWDLFRQDVIGMCDDAVERNPASDGSAGSVGGAAAKIKDLVEQMYEKTGKRQYQEMELLNDRHRFTIAMETTVNTEAAMQGKWKRDAFSERHYERLRTDAVCAGLSELDERIATYELKTTLEDKFIGLSYTYDDTGQSEGWMKSMLDEADDKNAQEMAALALSSDDGVVKAQVAASMQTLLIAVQDRVMTELGVLKQPELRSANWEYDTDKATESADSAPAEIVEQPVWGMDCYTRRNISTCLETEFDSDNVLSFVEKWLLPAINACPEDLAYNLSNAARILEGLPFDASSSLHQEKGTKPDQWSQTLLGKALIRKIHDSAPPWLRSAAHLLRKAISSLGQDFFRVHPKGHGSIVLCPKIPPNRLVTFYRGEVYPSWRWGEKMDAISFIQKRKGLKPRLPDFFNMALERPQSDPRGYGLLYVDASRKSGYGSMLSHSCKPSCEVRVAAIKGELVLAMTTLREMTIGDEVTFDYNAVTESLHEYQTAVCLCGHGQCRGSFLHFATADCYQQVLNRNSPVAVRLSQLIKGCTKKVMAEDDDRILKRHGFQTAAFGAVSVNRRKSTDSDITRTVLDSMDFVPVWLRTFVADILRYIEYERRALPIALICNQISNDSEETTACVSSAVKDQSRGPRDEPSIAKKPSIASAESESARNLGVEKPIKGSKPEPTFFYFARNRREHFLAMLMEEDTKSSMTGLELECEIKKKASLEWKTFSPEVKEHWKEQALADWEKNGGREKARLEEIRQTKLAGGNVSSSSSDKPVSSTSGADSYKKAEQATAAPRGEVPTDKNKISFQAADAEGISAMEQRIQQLTQALSRVGRVLDRHREEIMRKEKSVSPSKSLDSLADLRELAHSPLTIMPDEEVVAWMWNHDDGVVRTLLRMAAEEICVSPSMKMALKQTEVKFSALSEFGTPWIASHTTSKYSMSPSEGRKLLNEALLEFRGSLIDGIEVMSADIKKRKKLTTSCREAAKKKEEQAKEIDKISTDSSVYAIRYAVKFVLNDMLDTVELRAKKETAEDRAPKSQAEDDENFEPWLQNYSKRFKIEKAADLILLYARTSTFFRLKSYEPLQSTPIEVYARELGNAVPRAVMDESRILTTEKRNDKSTNAALQDSASNQMDVDNQDDNMSESSNHLSVASIQTGGHEPLKASTKAKVCGLCEPDDIVSEVVVDYQGDFVLSQLLQWYNAGIEQNPGLPDILGCALLPPMSGCWTIDYTKVVNASTGKSTGYRANIRPKLVDWLKDPYKRGNPWPDELRRGFVEKAHDRHIDDASNLWLPIGSPALDFLVTGDDFNMMDVLHELGSNSGAAENEASSGIMSSIDHGRPAQAVSNWVQCENPDCQKWRKIPWHVDIDMLSEKFVCSDNVWNAGSASCDAPEDVWDETADACVEADGSVKPVEFVKDSSIQEGDEAAPEFEKSFKLVDYKVGARFDVRRSGKEAWSIATVVDVDIVGMTNRIKFHFPRTQIKHDEWLEADSPRIAHLYTHTSPPQQRSHTVKSIHSKDKTSNKNDQKELQIEMLPSSETCTYTLPAGKESKAERLKNLKKLKEAMANDSSKELSFSQGNGQGGRLDISSDEEELADAIEDSASATVSDSSAHTPDEEDEENEFEGIDLGPPADGGRNFSGVGQDDHEDVGDDFSEEIVASSLPAVTDHSSPDGSPKREVDNSVTEACPVEYHAPSHNDSSPSFKIPKKRQQSPGSTSLIPVPNKSNTQGHVSLISNFGKPKDSRIPMKAPIVTEKLKKPPLQQFKRSEEINLHTTQHSGSRSRKEELSPDSAAGLKSAPQNSDIRNNWDFKSSDRPSPSIPSRPNARDSPRRGHSRPELLRGKRNPGSRIPGELHLSDDSGRNKYNWIGNNPHLEANSSSRDRWSEVSKHSSPRRANSPSQRRDHGMDSSGKLYEGYAGSTRNDHYDRIHGSNGQEVRNGYHSDVVIDSPRRSHTGGLESSRGAIRPNDDFIQRRDHRDRGDFRKIDRGADRYYDAQHEDGEEEEDHVGNHNKYHDGENIKHLTHGQSRQHECDNESWTYHSRRGEPNDSAVEREYGESFRVTERPWRGDDNDYDEHRRDEAAYGEDYKARGRELRRESPSGRRESYSPRDEDRRRQRVSGRRKEERTRRTFDGKDEYSRRLEDYRHLTMSQDHAPRYDDRGDASKERYSRRWDEDQDHSPRKSRYDVHRSG